MADAHPGQGGTDGGADGPVVRDRRRLDPQTGKVREAYAENAPEPGPAQGQAPAGPGTDDAAAAWAGPSTVPGHESIVDPAVTGAVTGAGPGAATGGSADVEAAQRLADERLADLQRLQAEYVNYRKRVERDRDVARDTAVAGVLEALLPVLDDVHLARQHGDLEGTPFSAIADKLEATLARFGLARYGEPGETFDPTVHEALIHTQAELAEGTTDTTVVQILQPGYRAKDRVLRAARVAVADPS